MRSQFYYNSKIKAFPQMKEGLILLWNGANWKPAATVIIIPVHIIGIEVNVPRIVWMEWIAPIKFRRPIEAVRTRIVEISGFTVASGGKEDALAIGPCYQSSFYTVLCCPGPGAILSQFGPLCWVGILQLPPSITWATSSSCSSNVLLSTVPNELSMLYLENGPDLLWPNL